MSTKLIALAGSLVISGGIYYAVKSRSPVKENKKTAKVIDTVLTEAQRIIDSSFQLPASTGKFPVVLIRKKEGDEASVPMKISNVKVDVKVAGNLATTLYDITYCNELNRILDGQFCFPLGEGQSISYFALEIDGKLREASIVEKAKGRQTYEAVIRKKIDPALLEWTAGNNFRTRVYPIPAKGCKRIVVGFEQELLNKSNSTVYYQPLSFPNTLDNFSLHAEVLNQPVQPSQLDEQGMPVKFQNAGNNWVYDKHFFNYSAATAIAFEIPKNDRSRNVMVEKTNDGSSVFYLNVIPEKFSAPKTLPARLCVLWDVSASAEKRNLNSEKNILCSYLKKIQNTNVSFVTFSNDIHSTDQFVVTNGKTKDLEDKINSLIYDGGTQLGKLDLGSYNCDEFILVTDGISNFGEQHIKTSRTPVNILCSSSLSDYSYLKGVCKVSGGKFINLQTTDSATCVKELGTLEYQFISCSTTNSVTEMYPSSPLRVEKNFTIAGKLTDHKTDLKINFGIGNKILYTELVTVYNEPKDFKGIVQKAWAQKKLNELDVFYELNKQEITSLGKTYNIVTRNTSLLVLDRLEDYLEHRVEPKDTELKKQYLSHVNKIAKDQEEQRREHIELVVIDFNEMKEWYNKDFKPVEYKKQLEPTEGTIRTDSIRVSTNVTSNNVQLQEVQLTQTISEDASKLTVGFTAPATGTYNVSVTDANACAWSNVNANKDEELSAEILLSGWDPQTPYMKEIKSVGAAQAYQKYISIRKQYASQPSFFVDVADYFVKQKDNPTAIRVLSNVAELDLENHQLLRVMAHRLQQLHENKLAISTYKKILEIREEEPQSYRDLGLAYADDKQYQKAVDYLCKVVSRKWDTRFPQVECLVAAEINHIIAKSETPLQLDSLDKRLIKALPCDVRVVINWDTDNCDMDLWVTDPAGQKCFYSEPLTQSGGRLSRDFTGGYGPEVFMVKKASKGKYLVQVNYYGNSNQSLTGPTTVQAELYTNWGRANESRKTITLRLDSQADVIDIGDLAFTIQ